MTVKEQTKKHIINVGDKLQSFSDRLKYRASIHDQSKLEEPEASVFEDYTHRLAGMTYGSDEYQQCLEEMKPACLNHHYENNPHHPEHFENGVDDMDLVDLVEMFCDWKAATERHDDGDINKSIIYNTERFNLSPQLVRILQNSVKLF